MAKNPASNRAFSRSHNLAASLKFTRHWQTDPVCQ